MAQYDLHKNRNARTRALYPLLLEVQSDLLGHLSSTVVIPLSQLADVDHVELEKLTPSLAFDGISYSLMTDLVASISRSALGPVVGELSDERSTIIAATDFLLTGA